MRKLFVSLAIVGALVLAFGSITLASAQAPDGDWVCGEGRGGPGMMWNRPDGVGTGFMHDAMIAAVAERLDVTVEELEARLSAGETLWQVLQSEGLTAEEALALKQEARQTALDQAVADGLITQEQADWMAQRSQHMGRGIGGMMGGGRFGSDQNRSQGFGFRGMMGLRFG